MRNKIKNAFHFSIKTDEQREREKRQTKTLSPEEIKYASIHRALYDKIEELSRLREEMQIL